MMSLKRFKAKVSPRNQFLVSLLRSGGVFLLLALSMVAIHEAGHLKVLEWTGGEGYIVDNFTYITREGNPAWLVWVGGGLIDGLYALLMLIVLNDPWEDVAAEGFLIGALIYMVAEGTYPIHGQYWLLAPAGAVAQLIGLTWWGIRFIQTVSEMELSPLIQRD